MIEVYNTFTPTACKHLINLFNNDSRRLPGTVGTDISNNHWKKSLDLGCHLDRDDEFSEYNDIVREGVVKGLDLYVEKYWTLKTGAQFYIYPHYNIQYYGDGDGYFASHIEYMPWPGTSFAYRLLAWMINLNDAQCGTEFVLQKQILKAQMGNLSIWPAYWTHHHKGVCPNVGDKYIVTGWCTYKPFEPSTSNRQWVGT